MSCPTIVRDRSVFLEHHTGRLNFSITIHSEDDNEHMPPKLIKADAEHFSGSEILRKLHAASQRVRDWRSNCKNWEQSCIFFAYVYLAASYVHLNRFGFPLSLSDFKKRMSLDWTRQLHLTSKYKYTKVQSQVACNAWWTYPCLKTRSAGRSCSSRVEMAPRGRDHDWAVLNQRSWEIAEP